ncbi:MAG: haloacid dehalogenase-like hydrolase [Candidatus Melainabacteria bacterium]|nr:haloacid dehalogenase-like hydrolase [Candidatus Melainabacteria bacterium]
MKEHRHREANIWQPEWTNTLAQCRHKRLVIVDLDGTIWDDLLVVLNEAFGPVDASGDKIWRQYDRAFKVLGTMTNGAHLEAEYRDLLTASTLENIVAWLKVNHRLVPGIHDFIKLLDEHDVSIVAVSNGAYQIADEMFAHHGVSMPRVCNSLNMDGDTFNALDFFHDEHEGIRKGDLVAMAVELGYEVIACAGDSKGDLSLATDTAKVGGLVIAVNKNGLSAWCEANQDQVGGPDGWIAISDYAEAVPAIMSRLKGN